MATASFKMAVPVQDPAMDDDMFALSDNEEQRTDARTEFARSTASAAASLVGHSALKRKASDAEEAAAASSKKSRSGGMCLVRCLLLPSGG